MYGKVVSVRVPPNVAGNQWDGSENSPYDPAIESTLVQCLTNLFNDIMFIAYGNNDHVDTKNVDSGHVNTIVK
ncbi:hypothetical protein DSO57_1010480 [Entomophthora muscae]|uniref:Uncharacterized protein n=1 Tax=Entomophthora muscae TaxID=34485 RepID=A0ACC2SJJ7_9FUNG|nr:hypothetical protein DSO57_1010480 [Entomophthora muscae]